MRNKKINKIGIIFIVLIGACGLFIFGAREVEKRDLSKYKYWIVDTEITDYKFIEDGRVIAVDWHSKKEVSQQVSLLDEKPKFGSPGQLVGRRFIVSYAARLKEKPSWNEVRDDFPILEQNYPNKGEYWRINVYDTKDEKLGKKVLDVFEMTRNYDKSYYPAFILNNQSIDIIDGKEYLTISLRKKEDKITDARDESKLVNRLIDLETGKIVDINSINQKKESSKIRLGTIESFSQLFKNNNFSFSNDSMHFWKLGNNTRQWLLNKKYPKAMEIISKNTKTSYIYKLSSEDDLQTSIDMIKLVFPEGTNIFKDITIPASSSKDGQEHTVQSEEEFLEYYQVN
ncbi:hypothetical protein D8880_05360 [Streptococcus sanguinis]|uniref:hypothetical protein n=1 Tax=Streptococcus sanguinis TaxID=1305 RepID=UPI000FBA82A5|nr:hypothetical protein [Streptococcus sanguinis]RSI27646.1 hypothetical protein D8880_05360 [Streptococcus sanguinis]